jgi:hypothetical protein
MTRTRRTDGASDHYLIRGGLDGRVRLRVLARVMWPTTRELPALRAWISAPRLVMVAGVVICPAASVASSGGMNRAMR